MDNFRWMHNLTLLLFLIVYTIIVSILGSIFKYSEKAQVILHFSKFVTVEVGRVE